MFIHFSLNLCLASGIHWILTHLNVALFRTPKIQPFRGWLAQHFPTSSWLKKGRWLQTANTGKLLGMEVEPSLSIKNQDKCSCATVSFFFKVQGAVGGQLHEWLNFFVLSKIVTWNTTGKFLIWKSYCHFWSPFDDAVKMCWIQEIQMWCWVKLELDSSFFFLGKSKQLNQTLIYLLNWRHEKRDSWKFSFW